MLVLASYRHASDVRPVSTVRARLAQLREDVAAAGTAAASDRAPADDLRARLKRMRRPSPPAGAARVAPDEGALCERIGGRPLADGLMVCEHRLPGGFRHGKIALDAARASNALGFFLPGRECDPEAIAFLDTETTGLSGGTGTLVFQIGLARWRDGTLDVAQYLLCRVEGEAAMLDHARNWLAGVRAMVTFNGKSFDAPLLATRYRLAVSRDPFSTLRHLDLLHPARRAFARRFDDCRLGTLERSLLGLEREGDLPGHEVPRAWFDWLRRGESVALARVLEHNRLDLLSLAALLPILHDCYRDPVGRGADPRVVLPPGARGPGSDPAYRYLRARRLRLDDDSLRALARCARRRRDWLLAVDIWAALAATNCIESLESLAKYYEHIARDFREASASTSTLIALEPVAARHRHRAARLRVKRETLSARDAGV